MTRALILAAMLILATPRSEPNGSLAPIGQLTTTVMPSPVHSARTGAPLRVSGSLWGAVRYRSLDSHGAALDAASEDTRQASPAEFDLATGSARLGGAPTHRGTWAYANPSHGAGYLATPEPRGTRIRVCGPLGCRTLITNDVGPVLSLQRAGRIGDLSAVTFGAICGDLSRGLCVGSYVVLAPLPPLPPTDEAH